MARTFTASCDKMGIAKLKQDLMAYQKSLRSKNQLFIEELCNLGIPVIKRNINTAQGDSDPAHSTVITIATIGDVCKGTLTLSGKDVLFLSLEQVSITTMEMLILKRPAWLRCRNLSWSAICDKSRLLVVQR